MLIKSYCGSEWAKVMICKNFVRYFSMSNRLSDINSLACPVNIYCFSDHVNEFCSFFLHSHKIFQSLISESSLSFILLSVGFVT